MTSIKDVSREVIYFLVDYINNKKEAKTPLSVYIKHKKGNLVLHLQLAAVADGGCFNGNDIYAICE